MSATRILFGCGYLGSRVANLWRDVGEHTIAATRGENPTPATIDACTFAMQADVTKPDTLRWFSTAGGKRLGGTPPESLLYAVGYDRVSGIDIHAVYAGGLRNVLAAAPPSIDRVIYISTTGVYGAAGGEWVDESTPPDPQREGGRASLAAEQVLAAHPLGGRSAILRLAGIYGPGRVPHLDKLRSGEPLPVPADGWLNLIHVDDAARIVVAADAWLARQPRAEAPHVFCVSDGCPIVRRDYYAEVARVLGTVPPQFSAPPPDSSAAARAGVSRCVSNRKMRELLAVPLKYPTYSEGLAAILLATL